MTSNSEAVSVSVSQRAREAAATVFDSLAQKARHVEVAALNRHHAEVIRAGDGDDYDAVQAAMIALSTPPAAGQSDSGLVEAAKLAMHILQAMGDTEDGVTRAYQTLAEAVYAA